MECTGQVILVRHFRGLSGIQDVQTLNTACLCHLSRAILARDILRQCSNLRFLSYDDDDLGHPKAQNIIIIIIIIRRETMLGSDQSHTVV